jgi:hypothetical protein
MACRHRLRGTHNSRHTHTRTHAHTHLYLCLVGLRLLHQLRDGGQARVPAHRRHENPQRAAQVERARRHLAPLALGHLRQEQRAQQAAQQRARRASRVWGAAVRCGAPHGTRRTQLRQHREMEAGCSRRDAPASPLPTASTRPRRCSRAARCRQQAPTRWAAPAARRQPVESVVRACVAVVQSRQA